MINPKTAVETTDFADNTDKERIAVPGPGVFTRRVAETEVLDHDEARSHPPPTPGVPTWRRVSSTPHFILRIDGNNRLSARHILLG
ncbi:MAG: hypothetical protein WCQ21_14810, partial [Verrucomicrobiota bacterium]